MYIKFRRIMPTTTATTIEIVIQRQTHTCTHIHDSCRGGRKFTIRMNLHIKTATTINNKNTLIHIDSYIQTIAK